MNGETKKQKEEYLPTGKIDGDPAYVGISAGMTCNLGNFESARINISLTYPCDREKVDQVFDSAKNWLDKRLLAEIHELKQSAKSTDVEI